MHCFEIGEVNKRISTCVSASEIQHLHLDSSQIQRSKITKHDSRSSGRLVSQSSAFPENFVPQFPLRDYLEPMFEHRRIRAGVVLVVVAVQDVLNWLWSDALDLL